MHMIWRNDFLAWMKSNQPQVDKLVLANWNVDFDKSFLKANWHFAPWPFHHRTLDICAINAFMTGKLSGLSAVEKEPEPHQALEGARAALRVLRRLNNSVRVTDFDIPVDAKITGIEITKRLQ